MTGGFTNTKSFSGSSIDTTSSTSAGSFTTGTLTLPLPGLCARSASSIEPSLGGGRDYPGPWDTVSGSLASEMNQTTAVWTVGNTGRYLISFKITFPNNVVGARLIAVIAGGTVNYATLPDNPGGQLRIFAVMHRDLTVGTTVTAKILQSSGGNLTVTDLEFDVTRLN